MPNPLVSVIIPTWNRAHCLHHAVDSVIAQTYPHWEVVLIDDGSSDRTGDMVAARYGQEPRVRYIYQANAGVSAARNRGIAEVRGEYVALLDSDDVWEPWKLELQLACFQCCPEIGMVWTDMAAVQSDGQVVHQTYLHKMYAAYAYFKDADLFDKTYPLTDVAPNLSEDFPRNSKLMTGEIFSQMIMGNLVHTSTVMLTRQRLALVSGFRLDLERSGEDYDFHLRTCREGAVGFANVSSIRYQVGMPDQLTARSFQVDLARNFLKTITPIIEQDRSRIKLPERMIRRTLSYGHRWLGQELLMSGKTSEARPEFSHSLRLRWNLFSVAFYILSLLPDGSVDVLRAVYKTVLEPFIEG